MKTLNTMAKESPREMPCGQPLVPYQYSPDGDLLKGPDFYRVAVRGRIRTAEGDCYEEESGSKILKSVSGEY